MKIHRILGILWFAFCCYSILNLLRALLVIPPTAGAAWWVLVVDCLLYLAGIVASIFLFRGAGWPRWIVGLIAVYTGFGSIAFIVATRSLPDWSVPTSIFALVSLVLLLLPRHEPVA